MKELIADASKTETSLPLQQEVKLQQYLLKGVFDAPSLEQGRKEQFFDATSLEQSSKSVLMLHILMLRLEEVALGLI